MRNFLGIGAQKAGTSWLYEMLKLHPGVTLPAVKEIHFWDMQCEKGVEWYAALFENDGAQQKQGEITPAYSVLPVEVSREIHAFSPRLRVIYVTRKPIERAWSAALVALAMSEMTTDEAPDA